MAIFGKDWSRKQLSNRDPGRGGLLNARYSVSQINVFNRTDYMPSRINGFQVLLYDGANEVWSSGNVYGTVTVEFFYGALYPRPRTHSDGADTSVIFGSM